MSPERMRGFHDSKSEIQNQNLIILLDNQMEKTLSLSTLMNTNESIFERALASHLLLQAQDSSHTSDSLSTSLFSTNFNLQKKDEKSLG